MLRHELTDEQWDLVRPVLPRRREGGRGRKPADQRQMLHGIMCILRTGAPWRDLPERLGPWHTVYHYWRAAAAFEIKITKRKRPKSEPSKGRQSKSKARLSIAWKRRQSWSDWTALSEGCYLLRTNLTETDPVTLWKQYIQLTEVEWALRIEKHELGIRPIWHQKEDRVLGHILVCFLAYVLWKALAQWMRRSALGDAPRTLLEEFVKIKSGDVVLPAQMADGSRRTIHLRRVTTPDAAQKVLLHRLGLTLPQRLRRLDEIVPM